MQSKNQKATIKKATERLVLCGFCSLVFALYASADTGTEATGNVSHAAAPSIATPKQAAQGEVGTETITGKNLQKLDVGKFDPPAAFNLEDIQNFPEERLQPVLNNPVNFEEGRDFSAMMDFQDDQLYHPWLAELSKAPFLTMKTSVEKASSDWSFAIIDQAGATVWKQDGKGNPPPVLTWNGDDNLRGHAAVDTVYIPQLATTDKEGYHHTFMGQPVQFTSIVYKNNGKTVIELSSKNLFVDKKTDLSKEAPFLLEKVCDVIREEARLPFAIQPYDNDPELAQGRQQNLIKYFAEKLYIPENQIISSSPTSADKRGAAMAIISTATPGSVE